MVTDIFIWWLVVQVLGLLALPLTTFLFRTLPDRGYAFGKSMGLLLTGYGAWLLAMFGLASFGAALLVIVALLIGVAGLVVQRSRSPDQQHEDHSAPSAGRLAWIVGRNASFSLPSWRMILVYEGIFLAALVAVAVWRSYSPDPWGTERPMDYAFFNAIRTSAVFPPHDPWLSGYSINYYYFGYLLMASVALLSGRDPGVAYNLSLALIFALTALGVAGLLANLMAMTGRTRHQPSETTDSASAAPPTRSRFAPFAARVLVMLLGGILVLGVGNQVGALQLIIGDHRVVAFDGRQMVSALGQALRGAEQITLPTPVQTPDHEFGTFDTLEPERNIETFNNWWSSRALWDDYHLQGRPRQYTITEFPFFSFWLGDMHPHVMALPFGLLSMALALATLARTAPPVFARGRQGWADLLLTGLILGSLYTINSWDLPTYVLLYAGALLLLYLRLAGPGAALPWRDLGRQFGLVLLAVLVLFVPFYLTFHSLVGSAAPWLDLPLIGRLTQIIGFYSGVRSGLHAFLVIFGLFILPLVAFVYLAAGRQDAPAAARLSAQSRPETLGLLQHGLTPARLRERVAGLPDAVRRSWPEPILFWLPPTLLLLGLAVGFPLLALVGLGLLAGRQIQRVAIAPARSFVLLVVILGCAICFGTELIYIRDVFEGLSMRMNTIFKFYYQVWLLWGTVAAYAIWWLLACTTRRSRGIGIAVTGLAFVLLAGALVYPAVTLRNTVTYGTRHGLAGHTPREATPAGREAIAWLRQNVPPGSVVLEGVHPTGGSYNGEGFGGVSAGTGLPTVIGWTGHQSQWRGGDAAARAEIEPRKADVEQIYGTADPDRTLELLRKYGVDYIYVGSLERRTYPPEGLASLDQIARPVFQNAEVTIYELPPAS